MMRKICLRASLVVATLLLVATGVARASSITIYDTELGTWTVSWNDPRVTITDQTAGQSQTNPIRTTDLRKE